MLTTRELIRSIGTYKDVAKLIGKSEHSIKLYAIGSREMPKNIYNLLLNIKKGEVVDLSSDDKTTENVREMVENLGGVTPVALVLGKTYQAVYKWIKGKALPDDANWYLMKSFLKRKKRGN